MTLLSGVASVMGWLLPFTRSNSYEFNDAMAILAFLSFIKIFFNLNTFIEIADINEFRVLQIQIKKNVTPLYSSE